MIEYAHFENIIFNELGRDISASINPDQNKAIKAPIYSSLFIAAGPGSGKTTVMALKILKFIFVDEVDPASIIATTFTRKAALELKLRVLKWGEKVKNSIISDSNYFGNFNFIDLKNVVIGTVDSIAEELLRNHSDYTIIEDFVAASLMIKTGLLNQRLQNDRELKSFLNHIKGTKSRLNLSAISQTLLEIKDRAHHDRVDLKVFMENYGHPGALKALKAILCYEEELKKRSLLDFSMLEEELLRKIQNSELSAFLKRIKVIMVDEYQDTNLLQENIYFLMASAAVKNGGGIMVVGDDDQSLYRFRGATVDLFKDFKERIGTKLGIKPLFINLSRNYRSTENIVQFCNNYVALDKKFQKARVEGKESIISARGKPYSDFPVLGIFRDDIKTLASDLSSLVYTITQNGGFKFKHHNNEFKINIDSSPGDIAFLCSSPLEQDFKGNSRLPFLLKDELSKLSAELAVFNPRGQHLGRIPLIELICGLVLECIDPEAKIQKELRLPQNAAIRFKIWRGKALNYMNHLDSTGKVQIFKDTWIYEMKGENEEMRVPLDYIIFKIMELMPEIQKNDEIIYIEVITKTIIQTGLFSDFEANIILNKDKMRDSITEAIWNIFVPIALGAVNIDLDILEEIPKNRVNIMSIHQAKGLEFPIVIVDVGSDFRMNFSYHSFRRFPGNPGKSCTIEDKMREFSPIGKPARDGLNRAFDDLIRQYFVAFSRAKNVIILAGLNSVKEGYYFNGSTRYIPNMATGWDRDEEWLWKGLSNLVHL